MQDENERIIYIVECKKYKNGVYGMKKLRILCLLIVMAVFATMVANAVEENFQASSLTASDVDCKKCHEGTPHAIHANKPVDCADCHGNKESVSIPVCTKCHDGPIHQVHSEKVATQTCAYCHTTITQIHNNIMSDAVCSHCHTDLVEVHGKDASCTKCHNTPPDIVKPIKSPEMTLICQDCHQASNVATIHGAVDNKTGCYNCHKGTSKAVGSEVAHVIHSTKVDCKACHEENGKVVVPQCVRCHEIDDLHAFSKIGKLTPTSGLNCAVCHTDETKLSGAPVQTQVQNPAQITVTPVETVSTESTEKIPGFSAALAIGITFAGYMIVRRKE
jgi:hypothetical protein